MILSNYNFGIMLKFCVVTRTQIPGLLKSVATSQEVVQVS